jgi:hypothetical protein
MDHQSVSKHILPMSSSSSFSSSSAGAAARMGADADSEQHVSNLNQYQLQHHVDDAEDKTSKKKKNDSMVMSSLPYDERTEYDDLAGEAEPSLTPLPQPRGVLATTGATSRGGGGGGGGVRRSEVMEEED